MKLFGIFNKDNFGDTIYCPVNGVIVDIKEVNDPVFSEKIIGDGVAIKPDDGIIVSPCNGTIEHISSTKHAVAITSSKGLQILIHLGIDTVELQGKGFECFIKRGQSVKRGERMVSMDLDYISKMNKDCIIAIIIVNKQKFEITDKNSGKCIAGKTKLFKYKECNMK